MISLIDECAGFFAFLSSMFDLLPQPLQVLAVSAFGGMVYIAVLRNVRR